MCIHRTWSEVSSSIASSEPSDPERPMTLRLPPRVTEIALNDIDSTNSHAKQLATDNAKSWTLIWAKRQSAGRGRYARQWISPEGNVFWSMILRPEIAWPDVG